MVKVPFFDASLDSMASFSVSNGFCSASGAAKDPLNSWSSSGTRKTGLLVGDAWMPSFWACLDIRPLQRRYQQTEYNNHIWNVQFTLLVISSILLPQMLDPFQLLLLNSHYGPGHVLINASLVWWLVTSFSLGLSEIYLPVLIFGHQPKSMWFFEPSFIFVQLPWRVQSRRTVLWKCIFAHLFFQLYNREKEEIKE